MGFTIEKPGKRLTPHSLDKTKITLFSSMEKRNPKRTKPKRTVSKLREHRITQMISWTGTWAYKRGTQIFAEAWIKFFSDNLKSWRMR